MVTYYHFNGNVYTNFADMANAYFKVNKYYPVLSYKSGVFNYYYK